MLAAFKQLTMNGQINTLFRSISKAMTPLLFDGLHVNPKDKRTGTDADFIYEDGEVFIIGELKREGTELNTGQRILMERLATRLTGYKKVIPVFCSHPAIEYGDSVYIAGCKVEKYYMNGAWVTPQKETLFVDFFRHFVKPLAEDKEK